MKLHIGCGTKYLEGYVHVDAMQHEHVDYVCNATDLNVIESGAASEVYACHILEHVKRFELEGVLREWNRVLETGGLLRISVPDFEAIAHEYLSSQDLSKLQGLIYGGQTYEYNYHHIAFDFEFLKGQLEQSGFTDIERYEWRDFLPEGYDDFSRAYIPHMDFEKGRLMSLNLVAKKVG